MSGERIFFVTGANRGLGLEVVRHALSQGHRVVATARHPQSVLDALPDTGDRLLALALDVTDPQQAEHAVSVAQEQLGRIDVLVNNAGYGLLGAVEEASDAEVRRVFDVNVHGLLNVTRAALPVMRGQRAGTIINISSSGGIVSRQGWGIYCATKFAVEGLSEALRQEVAPLGIQVVMIEPGGFRTDALDESSVGMAELVIDDYAGTAGAIRDWARETNHNQPGDPAKAGEIIVDLAEEVKLPERLQLGADCFEAVELKLQRIAADQQVWRAVSLSTAFPDHA